MALVAATVVTSLVMPLIGVSPARAQPEPQPPREDGVPCGENSWGVCDTRATDRGYRYRYFGGQLVPEAIGSGGRGSGGVDCGDDCPPDPYAVCDLLLRLGPSPDMTPAQRAAYDAQVADCAIWTSDPDAVDVDDVADALADYLREELLPEATVTIQPAGRTFANLPTVFHTAIPEAFAFNVDEPVIATISAVPSYHWDFGDGEVGPNAPGIPYDPAVSPIDNPDAYVSHDYDEPGTYQVTLTVTWYGSFTVPGVAQAFPLEAVALSDSDAIEVQESAGVLTGNG